MYENVVYDRVIVLTLELFVLILILFQIRTKH